ncbi:MAG: hypothetical protein IH623_18570 [Verrucomicrobia bacterium]|nr:hypothetical protein [Verrucomicrobiota bacterium]
MTTVEQTFQTEDLKAQYQVVCAENEVLKTDNQRLAAEREIFAQALCDAQAQLGRLLGCSQ